MTPPARSNQSTLAGLPVEIAGIICDHLCLSDLLRFRLTSHHLNSVAILTLSSYLKEKDGLKDLCVLTSYNGLQTFYGILRIPNFRNQILTLRFFAPIVKNFMCPWLKDYGNKQHAFERSEAAFDIFKLIFEELENAPNLISITIGQDWLEQGQYINSNGHTIGCKDQDLDQEVLETLIPSRANFGRNFDGKGDEIFWRCYFAIRALRASGFSRCIVRLGLSGSSISIQQSVMDNTLRWKNMSPDLIGCLIQNIFIDMKEIEKNQEPYSSELKKVLESLGSLQQLTLECSHGHDLFFSSTTDFHPQNLATLVLHRTTIQASDFENFLTRECQNLRGIQIMMTEAEGVVGWDAILLAMSTLPQLESASLSYIDRMRPIGGFRDDGWTDDFTAEIHLCRDKDGDDGLSNSLKYLANSITYVPDYGLSGEPTSGLNESTLCLVLLPKISKSRGWPLSMD